MMPPLERTGASRSLAWPSCSSWCSRWPFFLGGGTDDQAAFVQERDYAHVLDEAKPPTLGDHRGRLRHHLRHVDIGYCTLAQMATSGLVAARLAGHETVRSLTRVTAVLPGPQ
jgi:hypothetical protein